MDVRKLNLKASKPQAVTPQTILSPAASLEQIFAGKLPFAGMSKLQVRSLVQEGKQLLPPPLLEKQGTVMRQLFDDCLQNDYSKRPSMEDVVARLSRNSYDAPINSFLVTDPIAR